MQGAAGGTVPGTRGQQAHGALRGSGPAGPEHAAARGFSMGRAGLMPKVALSGDSHRAKVALLQGQ